MAEVKLEVAGRLYPLTCRDGEEEHLLALGRIVDTRARDAGKAMGNMTENRHLLVTALLLADSLGELQKSVAARSSDQPTPDTETAEAIERLADRMEKLAAALETEGRNA